MVPAVLMTVMTSFRAGYLARVEEYRLIVGWTRCAVSEGVVLNNLISAEVLSLTW